MKKNLLIWIIVMLTSIVAAQNNCLDFDGTDDYVNCGNNSAFEISEGTIETWFKVDIINQQQTLIAKNLSGAYNNSFLLRIDQSTNKISFYLESTDSYTTIYSDDAIVANNWYHVAIQWGTSGMKMYVNGIVQTDTDASTYPVVASGADLTMGAYYAGPSNGYIQYLDGSMDEIRVWNDLRTEAEIRQNIYQEIPDPALEANLVAYYNYNEASGTTADNIEGTSAYDGTLNNYGSQTGYWQTSPAMFGPKNCLDFDGSYDFVDCDIDQSDLGNNFTIETWLYPRTASDHKGVAGPHGSGTSDGIAFLQYFSSSNTWLFGIGLGSTYLYEFVSLPLNKWSHCAMTVTGGNHVKLYLNGEFINEASSSGTFDPDPRGFWIGKSYDDVNRYFDGKIDEFRIWTYERTKTEIREYMCKSLTGNESGLLAYYTFDNSSGTALQDFALSDESQNDGTLTNMEDADWVTSTAFNTWLNTSSSSWSTVSNWSLGTVPGATDNVGIPDYSSDPIIIDNINVNNLVLGEEISVGDTAILNITGGTGHTIHGSYFNIGKTNLHAGTNLTITGSLYMLPLSTVNVKSQAALTIDKNLDFVLGGGTFNILSNENGTGSLIVGGSVSHNINTQRYVNVTAKGDKWHYVSSPVSGQVINDTWLIDNSITSDPAYQFFRFDEPTNYWIIYGSTGNPAAFEDTQFGDAKGYCLTRSSTGNLSFTGAVRTDATTIYSATYNESTGMGFNLVGNPYTCSVGIIANASTTNNFLTVNSALLDDNYEAVYIWDEQADWSNRRNDYKVISNASIQGYDPINQDYIQPGQAFMVKVKQAGNIEFTEDMQNHYDGNFYKNNNDIWPSIEIIAQNEELFNSTAIGFNEGMTTGLDPSYDIGKLKGNPDIAIYTRLVEDNGIDFAIQALDAKDIESYVIPLGVDVAEENILEFSITQQNLDVDVYLEDRLLNTSVNLSKQNYTANVTESGIGRFYVHFAAVGVEEDQNIVNPIQVYASGNTLTIINNQNLKGDIAIINIMGQQMNSCKLDGNPKQIIETSVPTGIYIVHIKIDNGIAYSEKVFVR